MTLHNPNHPAPEVGKFYEWRGPSHNFYMGQCTEAQGARVKFDGGPWMLDDGRDRETSPARGIVLPTYGAEGVRA